MTSFPPSDSPPPDTSPPLLVEIARDGGDWPGWAAEVAEAAARRAHARVLTAIGETLPEAGAEVSILLTDDAALHRLNRDFRGKDKPTNVLSFENGEVPLPGMPLFWGDMALAWETLAREAAAQGKTTRDHATHLVVHAMLHLMGYDHEDAAEAAAMEALEVAILESEFGVANPYAEETA